MLQYKFALKEIFWEEILDHHTLNAEFVVLWNWMLNVSLLWTIFVEGILEVLCLLCELDGNLILFDHVEVSEDFTSSGLLYPQGFIYFLLVSHHTGKPSDSSQPYITEGCKATYKAK